MSKVHGYIEICPLVVNRACNKYLIDRKKREAAAKEEAINYHMNKKWFPAKTKEKALEMTCDVFGYSWELNGGYWESVIASIEKQSKTAINHDCKIFISDDIHDCIERFIDDQN